MNLSVVMVGVVAGLAVATPVGPISMLLLDTGRRLGVRRGFAAALGVALTDLVYAAGAGVGGSRIRALVVGHERVLAIVSGVMLTGVAAWCIVHGLRTAAGEPSVVNPPGRGRLLRSFVTLTAVNPLTIVAFVAVATGPDVRLTSLTIPLFAAVVFAVSLAWQTLLVGGGAVLGRMLPPGFQRATAIGGGLMIAALAARAFLS
jgi:threonine/homoserine/homoserine lactone efflux protein